jgi:hypothetical protein
MKLVEGINYNRRLNQPSSVTFLAREYVDSIFCSVPSDFEDEPPVRNTFCKLQAIKGISLDMLMYHYKKKHKDTSPSERWSLLSMGFTATSAAVATKAVEGAPIPSESDIDEVDESARHEIVAYRTQ